MDPRAIQAEIKKNRIREGPLYKRSKFMKEWRQRWTVLTSNYIFTFTNKSCQEVTDIIDLKEVKSYKSYLRKDEEMIPAGFKIRTKESMVYFCCNSAFDKWSWLVTLERLMDFKYMGTTAYNNLDSIKTAGFPSQEEFQRGGFEKNAKVIPDGLITGPEDKNVDKEADQIMKKLEQQKTVLAQREAEMVKKEQELRAQEQVLIKKQSESQSVSKAPPSPVKPVPPPPQTNAPPSQSQSPSSRVSSLKQLYEKKVQQITTQSQTPQYQLGFANNSQNPHLESNVRELYGQRLRCVQALFSQFYPFNPSGGHKYMIDFLVKIVARPEDGYQAPFVAEAKAHDNKEHVSQVLKQFLTDYSDYENAHLLAQFLQLLIFQAPSMMKTMHHQLAARKLMSFVLGKVGDQVKLESILRTMFVLHRIHPYQKNSANTQPLKTELTRLNREAKMESVKNWARKMTDQL